MNNSRIGAIVVVALLIVSVPILMLFAVIGGGDDKKPDADCAPTAPLTDLVVNDLPTDKVGAYGKKQLTNAAIIINEAKQRNLGRQAAVIALMTSMVESNLLNLANDGSFKYPEGTGVMSKKQWDKARTVVIKSQDYPNEGIGSDWDSIGLFQQRPSAGWGDVKQIMNQSYSASKFYESLLKIKGWEKLSYGEAAQRVQVSAFPDRYAEKQSIAEAVVDALQGVTVSEADTENPISTCDESQTDEVISADGWVMPIKDYRGRPEAGGFGSPRGQYPHAGQDFSAPFNTEIYAAADGKVTRAGCSNLVVGRSPCQVQIDHGKEGKKRISTLYVHMYQDGVIAKEGDMVKAGQLIAKVGSNGRSTGPHLHFETWEDKTPVDPVPWLEEHKVKIPR